MGSWCETRNPEGMLRFAALFVLPVCAVLLFADPAPAQLVWFHTPDGPVTHRFVGGRPVQQLPGIQIHLGEERVRLVLQTVRTRAWECDRLDMSEVETARTNEASRLVVVRRSGRTVLLDATEVAGATEVDDEIHVVASLGPYVLVRRDYFSFCVCSVHGYAVRTWHWFDLRDGSPVQVNAPSRVAAALPGLEERMNLELRADIEDDGGDWQPILGGDLEVVGVEPRLVGGRWRARVHVQLGVPYAWSRGSTSYARDAHIASHASVGRRFAPFEEVPGYVLRFLAAHPGWRLGGVGLSVRAQRRLRTDGGDHTSD